MGLFLDKHLNYLNNKIKQKIICIPFVLTSDDDLSSPDLLLFLALRDRVYLYLYLFITFLYFFGFKTFVSVLWDHL